MPQRFASNGPPKNTKRVRPTRWRGAGEVGSFIFTPGLWTVLKKLHKGLNDCIELWPAVHVPYFSLVDLVVQT